MQGWQLTSYEPDSLRLNSLPSPQPARHQAVIRVRAVSLNFRDLLVIRGQYSRKLPLPLTVCSDAAGEVIAVGEAVTRVRLGDRVAAAFMPAWISGRADETKARSAMGAFAPGVLAEEIVLAEDALVPIPEHLTFEEAATLPCTGVTAWNALMVEGRVKPGETVLVQGTGGVSIFALQFALAAGARIAAVTSSAEKAERLRQLGAHTVINYASEPDWDDVIRKSVGAVDYVIEIGGTATIGKSIRATRMGGFIALIGNRAEGTADPGLTTALMKAIRIQGIFVGSREMFESMNRAIALHRIRPVVDSVFPFARAQDAFAHLAAARHFGKVVISL
jgi:NADPH:quinone reductase-like Zn-dependent oxidoreductase